MVHITGTDIERRVSRGDRMMSILRDSVYTQVKQNAILQKWRSIARPLETRRTSLWTHKSFPTTLHGPKGDLTKHRNSSYKSILRNNSLRMSGSTIKSRTSVVESPYSREAMYSRRRESIRETLERLGGARKARAAIQQKDPDFKSTEEQLNVWDSNELRGQHGDLTARTLARSNVVHNKKVTFSMLSPIENGKSPASPDVPETGVSNEGTPLGGVPAGRNGSSGILHGHAAMRSRHTSVPLLKSGDASSTSTDSSNQGRGRVIRLSLMVPGETELDTSMNSDGEFGSRAFQKRHRSRSRSRSPYRRRVRPRPKFKFLAKIVTSFLKSYAHHCVRVERTFETFDALDAILEPDAPKIDLMFNKMDYKTTKEAKFSSEAKRILQKPLGTRTEKELHHLQLALRNYQSIGEYPIKLQKAIAERGWYETFDTKRIIINEGHQAAFFYILLSGSVMVSAFDPEKGLSRTVCYLGKGDTFGELAILNCSPREITVISKEAVELLCMQSQDFLDIFMTGGAGHANEKFLKGVHCFKGWPMKKLHSDTKNSIFGYFRRGTVLTKDSTASEWLYVIKSGSCQVMKLLKYKTPVRQPLPDVKLKKILPDEDHEEFLERLLSEQQQDSQGKSKWFSRINMPELNIPNRIKDPEDANKRSSIKEDEENTSREHSSLHALKLLSKGPFLMSTSKMSSIPENGESDFASLAARSARSVHARRGTASSVVEKEDVSENRFVVLEVLTRGSVFGLSDLFCSGVQTCLSLVSNGAEVIMVNRRFFLEHCPQRLYNDLRTNIYPYPSEEELERSLRMKLSWEITKRNTMSDYVRQKRLLKANVNDCRATLDITN